MIDFMKLRLRPIELDELEKDQLHTVFYALPDSRRPDRRVIWYTTVLGFSEELGKWEADRNPYHRNYWYNSMGTAQDSPIPDEDWEELLLFSIHK